MSDILFKMFDLSDIPQLILFIGMVIYYQRNSIKNPFVTKEQCQVKASDLKDDIKELIKDVRELRERVMELLKKGD